MVKTSKEIRQEFIDFFTGQGHKVIPSSRVVPSDDPTLLFINAGMNQFKDIFLGGKSPECPRAVNSQKCIRVSGKHNDLEEVGKDTYHHTFFEMLGNWSFGDYFKREAIIWAWQLITEVWKIDKSRLWATVFAGSEEEGIPVDTEAEGFWRDSTDISPDHILRFGKKDNFWEMGSTGPCGPCSEIHLDLGPDRCDMQGVAGHKCGVNGDCGRFIELWNLVFIQYNRLESGKLEQLPMCHVDTGAGLERITAVLQGKKSNYDTDLFMPIINQIEDITGKKYTSRLGKQTDNAFRVIADHVRTLTVAIADGALPGNDGRGYVLRRILRRAARFGLLLDMHEPFIYKLVSAVVDILGGVYPELVQRSKHVQNVIQVEEATFGRTLERGIAIFQSDIAEMSKHNLKVLSGEKAFRLYDTYGFPLDLTQLMANEQGVGVDADGFDKLMQQQRARARAARKDVAYQADKLSDLLPATSDVEKYNTNVLSARIMGYVKDNEFITEGEIPVGVRVGLVLDRSCAYSESGGQVGDKGIIETEIVFDPDGDVEDPPDISPAVFHFDDTCKIGPAVVHFGKLKPSSSAMAVYSNVIIRIDPSRDDIRRNHTATHLLQWALREVLGEHVHQEGSYVGAEYLRFDFTHPQQLTSEQIRQVEDLVREKIDAALPVTFNVLPIEKAHKVGAMALFSEKYGSHVRVLAIGTDRPDRLEEAFSREFCGGTHVNNTRDIGPFKIVREESVATGVRRITAMTGRALTMRFYQQWQQLEDISALLKVPGEQIVPRLEKLLRENKELQKQAKKGVSSDLKSVVQGLLDKSPQVNSSRVITGVLPAGASVELIRGQIDWLRKKAPSSVIVLANTPQEGKVFLISAVTDDLVKKGIKAGDIVKHIAPIVGGGGGGRPQMAQAGGKDPSKIPTALEAARELITSKLNDA